MSYTIQEALKAVNFKGGNTGKGLRIATMEVSKSKALLEISDSVFPVDDWIGADEVRGHGYYTTAPIMEVFPEAEIICVPGTKRGIDYLVDEFKPHIVNMSLSSSMYPSMEFQMAKESVLLTSAGNSGDKGETQSARQEWWWAVGAVELDDEFTPMSYSSYGLGTVRSVGISGWTYNGSKAKHGTSFASPFNAILLAEYFCEFEKEHGAFPSIETALGFMRKNSQDIQEVGKDLKTGYGLLVLPNKYEYNTLEFEAVPATVKPGRRLDSAKGYKRNGKMKVMDTIPVVDQNWRTLLPVRYVAEEMGGTIVWSRRNTGVIDIKVVWNK